MKEYKKIGVTTYEYQRFAEIGIQIAAKALNIDPIPILFTSIEYLENRSITAMYLPGKNIIIYNEKWLKQAPLMEIFLTAIHETRHAFQKLQIDALKMNKNQVPEEIVSCWEKEFDHYHQARGDTLNDYDYLNQEIEKDAIAFSREHMKKLMEQQQVEYPQIVRDK